MNLRFDFHPFDDDNKMDGSQTSNSCNIRVEHTVVVSNTWDVTGQNVVAAHTGTVKRPPTPQWPRPLARVM